MTTPQIPLVRRFPALASVPRVLLGVFPTPIDQLPGERPLWVKRDDRSTTRYGGNKIRALEFLLGGAQTGDTVLTMGGEGSTHVMVTSAVARRLGMTVRAIRWPHEMNPEASLTAGRVRALGAQILKSRNAVQGMIRAWILRRRPRVRWPSRSRPGRCRSLASWYSRSGLAVRRRGSPWGFTWGGFARGWSPCESDHAC